MVFLGIEARDVSNHSGRLGDVQLLSNGLARVVVWQKLIGIHAVGYYGKGVCGIPSLYMHLFGALGVAQNMGWDGVRPSNTQSNHRHGHS